MMNRHLVGLLLGTEEDWPAAFETLMRRMGPVRAGAGEEHTFDVERVTIEPFDLRVKPRYDLVIDRLAYWYYVPREWLKKVALMDDVYLLNSPFTFQSMEKHAAYCAMMRLGLKVPETVLVPYKNPPEHAKWAYTAARYNRPFDLDAIAERMGYPMFMKPYDGGAWVGVSRIADRAELHAAYDESGQRLMHLQKAVEDYDVFARSYQLLKSRGYPIQYTFHLSDFVDYTHPEFVDQVPAPGDGVYVPQALRVPLAKKLPLFQRAIETIAADYEFATLGEWAATIA